MEQTFNDLCNERKQQTEQGLFGFVVWIFVETAIGVIKEHVQLITRGKTMKSITRNLALAALLSLILVLPFLILEWVNHRNLHGGFPIALFLFLWLLPVAFVIILMPIVRNVRAGNSVMANPITLLFRVAFLVLIAMMWGGTINDQLPCFLGVPNCD